MYGCNASMIPNNTCVEWILELAKDADITLQVGAGSGYGEDGSVLQRAALGIPAINLGVPTRYGHSQSGVIDRADYDNLVKLLVAMIQKLSADQVKTIRTF